MAKGRSIAALLGALGSTLDTTGPQAQDRPGVTTAKLAEQLRTKLAARNALPPDPPVAPTHLPAGVKRYGGDPLAPLVVSRRAGQAVGAPAATAGSATSRATSDADSLLGLTPATERFLTGGHAPPRPQLVDSPGAVHHRQAVQAAPPAPTPAAPSLLNQDVDRDEAERAELPIPSRRPAPRAQSAPELGEARAGRAAGQGALALVDSDSAAPADRLAGATAVLDAPKVSIPLRKEATPGAIPSEAPVWPGPFQFVTGPAGSGKTTLVRGWRQHDEGFILCATTGIAAVNLGDAVTINATLRYSTSDVLEDFFVNGFLQGRMRKLRAAGVTRYGIDEISMMGAKALTILTQAVEEVNSDASVEMGHDPKIGITVVGDFLQLPPVKEAYAFESPEWHKYEAHTRKLEGNHRAAGDVDFITALRAIRVGDPQTALQILRTSIYPSADRQYPGTMILGKNIQVDRHNKLLYAAVPGESIRFTNITTGEPLREWERNIPMWVDLKLGVRVMILANRYTEGLGDGNRELLYANGDCGVVVEANPERKSCVVQLERSGALVTVIYNIRQNLTPNGKRGKKAERYDVLGEIEYMPLRLAYCSSVHKSQGLTLDRVQVDISDPFFCAPAMTYVALSRARSLEGLRIVGNPELLLKRCTVDPKVERWR